PHRSAAILFLMIAATSSGQESSLQLPHIFGDHMVLQRDKPVEIWGQAAPFASVKVEFGDQAVGTSADADGHWNLELAEMKSSADPRELQITSGDSRIRISNVLVGDVWLCGGQSNMEWRLRGARDSDVEIPSARYPVIRFIRLPKIARLEPQPDFPVESPEQSVGNWRQCMPDQVENCTAVGYYFARRIHRRLKVPVGLIDTSWGGTMAQHWVTQATLRGIPEVQPYFESFEMAL
ncbi:MAG: 9-O-acetylesterase, partial [Fuerstiella sp.]|nr:9-O-acetylesterase [Fuerstiella sp.]